MRFHAYYHPSAILPPLLALVDLISAATTLYRPTMLRPRDPAEHVVLADCHDKQGVVSSQMAYFPNAPGPKPQDVVVVATPDGQQALWAGTTTSAKFTATGVIFKAKLGPKVAEGQFAGTGDNGYGDFTCWQRYNLNLYTVGNTTCSQVYDCSHEEKPADTVATPTPNPSTPAGSSSSSTGQSAGLSTGALAAIVAGVIGAFLIGLAATGFIWVRRRGSAEGFSGGLCGCFKKRKAAELQAASGHTDHGPIVPGTAMEKTPEINPVYELATPWSPGVAEAAGTPRAEIDGTQRTELDHGPRPFSWIQEQKPDVYGYLPHEQKK